MKEKDFQELEEWFTIALNAPIEVASSSAGPRLIYSRVEKQFLLYIQRGEQPVMYDDLRKAVEAFEAEVTTQKARDLTP